MATVAIAPAPAPAPSRVPKRGHDEGTASKITSQPSKRPRRLNYEKCSFCRKDKKRCERSGEWPDVKCQRCIDKEFECSEPISGKPAKISKAQNHEGIDEDDASLLKRIIHVQNLSCWLRDQGSIKEDARIIYNDYYGYYRDISGSEDNEMAERYRQLLPLLSEAQERVTISTQNLFQILRASQSSQHLLYTHTLSNLLSKTRPPEWSHVELDPETCGKHGLAAEQVYNLHRSGAIGLAKAMQEHLVSSIASPIARGHSFWRLQHEASKLNQLDAEFSSTISEESKEFGLSPIPLLLRATNLISCHAIKAILDQYSQEATQTDPIGRSPLHIAFERRPASVPSWICYHLSDRRYGYVHGENCQFKALLDWGVPVTTRDMFGRTVLHLACFNNFGVDIIQMLIEALNDDVDSKDVSGRTAFSWAVEKGHIDVATHLLATGKVDINSEDIPNWTPLCYAVGESNKSMVKMLLDRHDLAPSSILSAVKSSVPRHFWDAREHNKDAEVVWMLVRHVAHNIQADHSSSLLSAVVESDPDIWQIMLSEARTKGEYHLVKSLRAISTMDGLSLPAISTTDGLGMTALDWARREGHEYLTFVLEGIENCLTWHDFEEPT
ncbi:hypothetical protein FKW77_009653 [Venturia effusa]|uniref:Zn(2)-C6 fungal-type domain-containing protein n=1 Tax=Venturia effusa TaxID=50376 RepID=A0A517L849_9PEZI|nr:hypothetical protein FKW77_009653 [Venturia effusa]